MYFSFWLNVRVLYQTDETQNPKLQQSYKAKLMEILKWAEEIKKNKLGNASSKTSSKSEKSSKGSGDSKGNEEGKEKSKGDEDSNKLISQIKDSIVKWEDINITWEDVAGLEVAKDSLKEAVILPTKFP